jgi:hypothetical protein
MEVYFCLSKLPKKTRRLSNAVFISDFQNCFHSPVHVSQDDLKEWVPGEGIRIGSSASDVQKKYGTPSRKTKIDFSLLKVLLKGYPGGGELTKFGEENLSYAADLQVPDLSAAEFGIREGKVSYIMLSSRE